MKKFTNRKYLIKCRACPTGFFSKSSRTLYCETCREIKALKKKMDKEFRQQKRSLKREKFVNSQLEFPLHFYKFKRLNAGHPYIYLID
jgi:hypothetical protein